MGNGYSYETSPAEFRGARVGIVKSENSDIIYHNDGYQAQPVLIRSYKDGVRVGCTFIKTNALRDIWEKHSKYLFNREEYVEHQSGKL